MSNPIAVLVEDDPEQMAVSKDLLETEGFDVEAFDAIAPVLEYLRNPPDLVDLFVLDRRLPVIPGDVSSDEFGDELLQQVCSEHPDACIVVFTGFASVSQVQHAVRGSAPLPAHNGDALDRIRVLEKHQSLAFRDHVRGFRAVLQAHENVELVSEGDRIEGALQKRMLRRLAHQYGATSISVRFLKGGLTGAAVWRCELRGPAGPICEVVAKQSKAKNSAGVRLTELVSRTLVATGIGVVRGLMAGEQIQVLQVAGEDPVALMDLIAAEPDRAVAIVRPVFDAFDGLQSLGSTLPIEEICAPLISWAGLAENLREYGVKLPAGTLVATTNLRACHGDLHPGNVLSVEGEPVLIDFDSSTHASAALDSVVLLVSTLVHPDSPIRGSAWVGIEHIRSSFGTADFGVGHPSEAWFSSVHAWMIECCASERERWALVLAYCGRQLGYDDVYTSPDVVERVLALAHLAAEKLSD